MDQARVLVTGSCGLIGSEVCLHFHQAGYSVLGIDNNQRAVFFGPEGDTSWSLQRLRQNVPGYEHHDIDIRDREGILRLVESTRPAVIVHTAAQPSHDRAAQIAFDDFDTNAVGTLNLLEAARRWTPESPFIHMSTNKVYGDRPNTLALVEKETRWDYADPEYRLGIPERLFDRPIAALVVRRIEGGFRCHGARVRALLRHAHVRLTRRLPDRTQSFRRGTAWIS